MLTFSIPSLQERRDDPVARVAFFAYCLITYAIHPGERQPCVCCGQPGPGDWCNTCDVAGNRPLAGFPHFKPHLVTPMCNRCVRDNVKCVVCNTRPEEGPPDRFEAGLHMAGWS